jgi:hypothetical protein
MRDMKIDQELIKMYIGDRSIVTLLYRKETFHCQLLKDSKDFILIRNCEDWHFREYIILLKKHIKSIKYGKIEMFRNGVFWSLEQKEYSAEWVDLYSFDSLLESIKNNYNLICIYGTTKSEDTFFVGRIVKYNSAYLYINQITPFGKLTKKEYPNEIDKITKISFGCKYSKALFDYAKLEKQ